MKMMKLLKVHTIAMTLVLCGCGGGGDGGSAGSAVSTTPYAPPIPVFNLDASLSNLFIDSSELGPLRATAPDGIAYELEVDYRAATDAIFQGTPSKKLVRSFSLRRVGDLGPKVTTSESIFYALNPFRIFGTEAEGRVTVYTQQSSPPLAAPRGTSGTLAIGKTYAVSNPSVEIGSSMVAWTLNDLYCLIVTTEGTGPVTERQCSHSAEISFPVNGQTLLFRTLPAGS